MSDQVTRFRIAIPDADLHDLRRRLHGTRWPERETVADWSQGVPLAYLQDLCRSWKELDRGGHFAAFEQPELFVGEVRAFFRTVR